MTPPILSPKWSGQHRRCARQSYSMKLAVLALLTVFAILAIMYFIMPPIG
jgi:hypothetical protein